MINKDLEKGCFVWWYLNTCEDLGNDVEKKFLEIIDEIASKIRKLIEKIRW